MSDPREEVPMGWTKGGSAPLRGALLGLVLERPGGGGDLTGRLRERFGEGWRVDRRDVYRLLEGLEREGLLECREQRIGGEREQESGRGGGRADRSHVHRGQAHRAKLVFHSTELTSKALSEWMGGECRWEPARHGIEAKLLVSSEGDAAALGRSLRHYELECLGLVGSLPPATGERESAEALLRDCARDGMVIRLQAEIDWARETRRRIEEWVALRPSRGSG